MFVDKDKVKIGDRFVMTNTLLYRDGVDDAGEPIIGHHYLRVLIEVTGFEAKGHNATYKAVEILEERDAPSWVNSQQQLERGHMTGGFRLGIDQPWFEEVG